MMNNKPGFIKKEQSNVLLGDITPVLLVSEMLCYTVNISPKEYIHGSIWGDMNPDEQYEILKRVHRTVYLKMYSYLNKDEDENNAVCFEFTKSGELHSHGYFKLLSKYSGYDKYRVLLQKEIKNSLTKKASNFMVYVKYAEEEKKWIDYIRKDIGKSGYEEYKSSIECETKRVTILDFLKNTK